MVSFWSHLWRCVTGQIVGMPGVVYSDEIDIERELAHHASLSWIAPLNSGTLHGIRRLGPEEAPYTFWERIGLAPVHPSRVRARQYYHPITDFAMYDYDEISPEEKELTARWMAHVLEFNGAVPAGILCAVGCIVLPLPTYLRMPLLVGAGAAGVGVEVTRSYMAAFRDRQDLDDFILAKELWYIKNIETYQLEVARIPRGREAEYHAYFSSDGLSQDKELPPDLVNSLHL